MLQMVLNDPKLQELYDYGPDDYEDLYTALNSDNVVVKATATIIKELDGTEDQGVWKKVYKTIFDQLYNNLLV